MSDTPDQTEARDAPALLDIAALEDWMAANIGGFTGPLTAEKFPGGQSNPTFKLTTPERRYVLRRKPPGKLLPGAHAVEREYRVMTALGKCDFPVPQTFGLCEDESVIGTAFFVMEMVEGRIFWDTRLPDVPSADRLAYYDAMNATIARLHCIDYEAAGLGDYGKPGNYFARQISRWSRQYKGDDAAGTLAALDKLVEWLPGNIPQEDDTTTLIHGDFRCDNMVFHPTEPRVLAVLDWELSTLGHPLADFAFHLMMYRLPVGLPAGMLGLDVKALGLPSEEEYVQAYCRRTGRAGIPHLDFYIAFNMFRFAAIIHGIKGRMLRGNASSAQADRLVRHLDELADCAWAEAQKAGAVA